MILSGRCCSIRVVALLVTLSFAGHVAASPQSEAVEMLIKYFGKKFGSDLAKEGVEQTTKRLSTLIAKYGDEVIEVVRPLGPRAVKCADDLGPDGYKFLKGYGREGLLVLEKHGAEAVELTRKYGDEAAEVLVRQPGVGVALVQTYPKEALPAIAKLSSDEAVHLLKMAPDFAKLPPEAQKTFAEKLAQGGDDFVVWAHKRRKEIFATEALATGAGLGAVSVLSAYKLGAGVAEKAPKLIPEAPDPEKTPGLWMFLVGVPMACITLVALAWVWRGRAKRRGWFGRRR